jgi:hypothetical protein
MYGGNAISGQLAGCSQYACHAVLAREFSDKHKAAATALGFAGARSALAFQTYSCSP